MVTEANIRPRAGVSVEEDRPLLKFLVWCLLLILCWPLALAALLLYPVVWLVLLPFRIVGIAVGGVLELIWAIVTFPARILRSAA
jgi:hypothetical protein